LGVCILAVARRSDYLVIDVSNSYAKLAFASRDRVSNPVRIPTSELSSKVVAEFLKRRQVKKLVVSSVVPKKKLRDLEGRAEQSASALARLETEAGYHG
jgi:pantothenate kinase type III